VHKNRKSLCAAANALVGVGHNFGWAVAHPANAAAPPMAATVAKLRMKKKKKKISSRLKSVAWDLSH